MLPRLLAPRTEIAYALLRVVVALSLSFHGAQKLFGVAGGHVPERFTQLWFGGVIELTTGLLVAAGAGTTWAAFLASGTMAVAYVQFHWKLQLGAQFFPAINRGETA